jgi:hypothetical protein
VKRYKKVKYQALFIVPNFAPYFSKKLKNLLIKVKQEDQEKENGLDEPIYNFTSQIALD